MFWQPGTLHKRHSFFWELLRMQIRNADKEVRTRRSESMCGERQEATMIEKRWFELLRWVMLVSLMAWTASGVAQEAANRAEPSSPGLRSDNSVSELRDQIGRASCRERV